MVKIQEQAWIMEHEKLARQTYRLMLQSPEIAAAARAGQFAMVRLGDGLDPLLRRPFSFHRIFPEQGIIEILYRIVGRGTGKLSRIQVGDSLDVMGPLGNAFRLPSCDSSLVVLVAGGIGIAPFFALMQDLVGRPDASLHLFYGARSGDELLPPQLFDGLRVTVHRSTDDGSLGYCGRVTDLFQEFMGSALPRPDAVYSCGPLAMQYHVARWALNQGVDAQLSLESLMACGVGACLGCALPAIGADDPATDHYLHVCKDGPIFSPGSIQWQKIQMHRALPQTFLYN